MVDEFRKRPQDIFEDNLMRKSVDYLAPQHQVPLIIQQSLTFESIDGQNFPYKLWFIINNPQFSDVLHWSQDGMAIVFPDDRLFVQRILKRKEGKIFKTESLKSFVRQLNLYGFRKVMSDRYDGLGRSKYGSMFDHEYFMRGRPDLIEYVKRRCNVKLGQRDSDTTPTGGLAAVLQDRTRAISYQTGFEYGERPPKRRLRFSPEGKENHDQITTENSQKMIGELTPSSNSYQSYFSLQGYPVTSQMLQNCEMATLSAIEEAAAIKQPSPSSKHLEGQQSVVTIPKSAMFPTPTRDHEATLDGNRPGLMDTLASIVSPNTPSEISQITAAYLTTPNSFLENATNFVSPTAINFYSASGPSPLSALCASLFSPFNENRSAIHKATQTSGEPKTFAEMICDPSGRDIVTSRNDGGPSGLNDENYYVMNAVSNFHKENVIKESDFMNDATNVTLEENETVDVTGIDKDSCVKLESPFSSKHTSLNG